MAAEYQGRRDLVVERLRGIPGIEPIVPEGGLFVMVDVRRLGPAVERGPAVPAPGSGGRRAAWSGVRSRGRGNAARLVCGRRRNPQSAASRDSEMGSCDSRIEHRGAKGKSSGRASAVI